MKPRHRLSIRRRLGAVATAVLLTLLVGCLPASKTDSDLRPATEPGVFGTSAWNEATWQ